MKPWNGAGGGGGVYWAWAVSRAASTSAPAEKVFRVNFMIFAFLLFDSNRVQRLNRGKMTISRPDVTAGGRKNAILKSNFCSSGGNPGASRAVMAASAPEFPVGAMTASLDSDANHESDSWMNAPLDSRQLRAFCVLARTGSFTQTAREPHLTQSGISHSMKALEAETSCHLLDRLGRKIALTGILDRCSSPCTGWAMGDTLITTLLSAALGVSFAQRRPTVG